MDATHARKGGEPVPEPPQSRRAFDELMLHVRRLLDSGELQPGDRLPAERTLAEEFGVGRGTVREALRMLEISGVVTLRRGAKGGAFIADPAAVLNAKVSKDLSLTDFSLEDLTDAMRWVCGMALRAAAPRLTESDFDALEEHLNEAERLPSDQQRAVFLVDFYARLAQAADNPILNVLVDNLLAILRAVVPLLHTTGDRHTHVIQSRRHLLTLLRDGDVDAAAAALDLYLVDLHDFWLDGPSPQMRRRGGSAPRAQI